MVDDATRTVRTAESADTETHGGRGYWPAEPLTVGPARVLTTERPSGHNVGVSAKITYGSSIPGESELRLCGGISGAKRTVELGVSEWFNSVEFALAGAKSIAVDPDPTRIAELRRRADASEVTVQCLEGDMADLGAISSTTCSVVVAAQTMIDVEDLGRLLRQVHRILIPSMPFIISVPHPFAGVTDAKPYGTTGRTVGDWFTALGRSNFRVDQVRELGVDPTHSVPTTLVLRALKEGS